MRCLEDRYSPENERYIRRIVSFQPALTMFKQVQAALQLWKTKNNISSEVELITCQHRAEGKFIYFRVGDVYYMYETVSGGDLSVRNEQTGKYRHIGNKSGVIREYRYGPIPSLIELFSRI